jgi:hypothetical protein
MVYRCFKIPKTENFVHSNMLVTSWKCMALKLCWVETRPFSHQNMLFGWDGGSKILRQFQNRSHPWSGGVSRQFIFSKNIFIFYCKSLMFKILFLKFDFQGLIFRVWFSQFDFQSLMFKILFSKFDFQSLIFNVYDVTPAWCLLGINIQWNWDLEVLWLFSLQ